MSRLIFEARRRLRPPRPARARSPSRRPGTTAGDPAVAAEAGAAVPDRDPDRRHDRGDGGHRDAADFPQTLFFPFVLLLAATALYRGTDNKTRTEEVDAERADYLRYLSVVRDNIRTQAAEQRAAAEWSHPDPAELASIPGSRRQWERDPNDSDFLVVRAAGTPCRSPPRCESTTSRTKST
ncbi:ESX-3 secretion system eccC3 domain protein [Mycobacterium xenopi 3993]|nr:ESX-3 secretion system eccC3 domain protein [Mycobacterium xenopi 3993]